MIKAISIQNQKFEYPDFLFEYLQPYLDKFSKTNSIIISDELTIPEIYLNDLIDLINESFRSLIKEKYQEPTHKQRSKYPSRYQKVKFEGVVYVVDYRKDLTGKIIYALNYLLSWLQEKLISQA